MTDVGAHFKGKKITVMGLGLLGRGVGDVLFLAKCGAKLTVTDLKSETELADSLEKLKSYDISYTLGRRRLEDFRGRDFILKAASVPLDSSFIAEARKHSVPIEMSSALFVRLAGIEVVGVTGTRGKSTTTQLIYEMLKASGRRVHLGGNVRGISTLALLERVLPGDIAVLELDSWQLQGFGEARISPHVAVFTNFFPDHMNYYRGDLAAYWKDKSHIFLHQNSGDLIIAGSAVAKRIADGHPIKGTLVVPDVGTIPAGWTPKLIGAHNLENISLAIAAATVLDVPDKDIRSVAESFEGVPGRLQFVRKHRGVEYYNDTTATIPIATVAGLNALRGKGGIVLIMGGADKGVDASELLERLPSRCKAVVLLPGTGTDKIKNQMSNVKCQFASGMRDAVRKASDIARKGDIVLMSPSFASFGLFKNEFDRGDQFIAAVQKL